MTGVVSTETVQAVTIRPRSNNVLVEPDALKDTTDGGIVIANPQGLQEGLRRATVIAAGPRVGKYTDKHNQLVDEIDALQPGDIVLIEPYGGTEILHEGSKYVLVADSGVVAYLEEGKDTAK